MVDYGKLFRGGVGHIDILLFQSIILIVVFSGRPQICSMQTGSSCQTWGFGFYQWGDRIYIYCGADEKLHVGAVLGSNIGMTMGPKLVLLL